MKTLAIFALFCFSLICCNQAKQDWNNMGLARQVGKKYAGENKNDRLVLVNFGIYYQDGIKGISLDYKLEKHVNIEDARRLLIKNCLNIVDLINRDEKIKSYPEHYPHSLKNIELGIHFVDKKGGEFIDGSVHSVNLVHIPRSNKTLVKYWVFDPNENDIEKFHQETYEEAERIVKSDV